MKSLREYELQLIKLWMDSISQTDKELKKIYEENIKNFEQLKKLNEQLNQTLNSSLENQERIGESKNLSSLNIQFNSYLYSWGGILEKVICLINQGNKQEKEKNNGDSCKLSPLLWVFSNNKSEDTQEASSESNGTGSQEALKKLKEVKESLSKQQEELRKKIKENLTLEAKLSALEIGLRSLNLLLNIDIKYLGWLIDGVNSKIKEKDEESRKILEKLKEKYKELNKAHKEWEKTKKGLIPLNHWKGRLQNAICINSYNKNLSLCEINNDLSKTKNS